jgi:septum formation protein
MNATDTQLILASGSPRRRELLALSGLDFRVMPAEVDEAPRSDEAPPDYVVRLAASKAKKVWGQLNADVMVFAADTTVVDGDQILGKPNDNLEAEKMLRQLRGRIHQVYTGISIAHNGNLVSDLCGSDVAMRQYSEDELMIYISSGDPFDKAGGYAIQNTDFHPVENFQGCFANVMGLPLCHLARALRKWGVHLEKDVPGACQDHLNYICPIYWKILREEI